jgi:DNA-binding NarL/FixJ family response regulator
MEGKKVMKVARVLVVDDHALFRKGVVGVIMEAEGFEVVGEAGEGREALAKVKELKPDVVVMDIYMPGMDGLETTRQIKEIVPAAKVVILTISEEDENLFEAVKAGANGYMLKSAEPETLCQTLRGVVRGEAVLSPSMGAKILEEFARQSRRAGEEASGPRLSPKEREVLQLLTRGAVNKEIAAALNITENTVKNHMKSIMEKLHLENRVQVVAYAFREGLVRKPETP